MKAKASGWYAEGGWNVPDSRWELDLRYDTYNRLKKRPYELEFKTTTVGAQYRFNNKTRLTIDSSFRDFSAVHFASGAGPNANLDGVGDLLAMQVTLIF